MTNITPEGTSNPNSGANFLMAPEEELLLPPPKATSEAVTESTTVTEVPTGSRSTDTPEEEKMGWGPNDRFPHDWAQG
jgi:hypothetical protein